MTTETNKIYTRLPISEAVKDGRFILGWTEGFPRATVVHWNGYGWTDGFVYYPRITHFTDMPVWVDTTAKPIELVELGRETEKREDQDVAVILYGFKMEDGTVVITRRAFENEVI